MLLRLTVKCQSPDCRQELAKVHLVGLGSSAVVTCPKCKRESEFTSVVGGVEAKLVEKAANLTSMRP